MHTLSNNLNIVVVIVVEVVVAATTVVVVVVVVVVVMVVLIACGSIASIIGGGRRKIMDRGSKRIESANNIMFIVKQVLLFIQNTKQNTYEYFKPTFSM